MDPITLTIVWGIVWMAAGGLGTAIIFMLFGVIFGLLKMPEVGVLIAWIAAIIWQGFAVIQVILHIVNLVQLIRA